MNEQRAAILLGATGLVGTYVLQHLLAEKRYHRVKVFLRRKMDAVHPKLEQHIIDFDDPQSWSALVNGNDVFCCLGTTIRTAGSEQAFRRVDLEYPLSFGKAAIANGVDQFILISSIGADAKSSNFYLRTKGEAEQQLRDMRFPSLIVLRPSMLLGQRNELRLGELAGKFFMRLFFFLFIGTLKKYRAIHATDVASAMVKLALGSNKGFRIVQSDEIQRIADER